MSKADKMFKELGYYQLNNGYLKKYNNGYTKFIAFVSGEYSISFPPTYHRTKINKKEHLAIHEKMKELGWLDE